MMDNEKFARITTDAANRLIDEIMAEGGGRTEVMSALIFLTVGVVSHVYDSDRLDAEVLDALRNATAENLASWRAASGHMPTGHA